MSKFLKEKYRILLPLFHFLLSFVYERRILIFKLDKEIIATIAKSEVISDGIERVTGYVLAKLFAFIFIWFLWKLVFFIFDNWARTYIKAYSITAVVGSVIMALMWPGQFVASEDNVITFSYALRFWPEYWHSAYSSIIYTACMMVIPYAWFISVFQWLFAVFTSGYVYDRIYDSKKLPKGGRYGALAVLLMPGFFTLVSNAYRTECYALLCMFLVSKVTFDIVDGVKASKWDIFKLMALCALVAVWRSEGIILGLLLFGVYLIFALKYKFTKILTMSILMVCMFVLALVPQKIGDYKYYGKDYSFINSFPTLQNILNAEGSNLSYDGADEDLKAISIVSPLPILQAYGMDGYRRYNYANGRKDINQSLASDEISSQYMKAYRNLVIHNPGIYLKTQVAMLAKMLMIKPYEYRESYDGVLVDDLEPWKLEAWDIGYEDVAATSYMTGAGKTLYGIVSSVFNGIDHFLTAIHFYTLILILIPMCEIWALIRELVMAIRKKPGCLGLGGVSFVILLQAFAIIMVMPYSTLVYLHAYYYSSFIFVLVYFLSTFVRNIKEN